MDVSSCEAREEDSRDGAGKLGEISGKSRWCASKVLLLLWLLMGEPQRPSGEAPPSFSFGVDEAWQPAPDAGLPKVSGARASENSQDAFLQGSSLLAPTSSTSFCPDRSLAYRVIPEAGPRQSPSRGARLATPSTSENPASQSPRPHPPPPQVRIPASVDGEDEVPCGRTALDAAAHKLSFRDPFAFLTTEPRS
jgi:hypothetical protein